MSDHSDAVMPQAAPPSRPSLPAESKAPRANQVQPAAESRCVFVPIMVLIVSWLAWSGFQLSQLVKERAELSALYDNQAPTVQTAQQMRRQLDALAAGTQRLADVGHPQAELIVQDLARRGITINPNANK